MSATYPQIGHVFANLPHSEKLSEAGQAEKGMQNSPLIFRKLIFFRFDLWKYGMC